MNRTIYIVRQIAYSMFSFVFFLCIALMFTLEGFFLLTLGGASDEHKLKYHVRLQSVARFVMNHVPGTTFSFSNASGEQFSTPSLIISNHQSHLDLMGIMMLTPKLIILTKGWVWHNPFYGAVIRYADFFPVDDIEKIESKLSAMLKKGYSVMIFPEGTRSEDCRIGRFHRGAFYLAEKFNLDIVPVFIDGFGKVLPKKSWHLHPGHMSVELMPRVIRENPENQIGYRDMARRMHNIYKEKKG